MPWDVLNTDYKNHAVIVLIQTSTSLAGMAHYIIVIAES